MSNYNNNLGFKQYHYVINRCFVKRDITICVYYLMYLKHKKGKCIFQVCVVYNQIKIGIKGYES